MQYNEGASLDPSQMGGGGGGGRGGGIAVGGGASILILILAMIFGFDPGALLGGGTSAAPGESAQNPFAACTSGADIAKNRDCRFVAYTNSIQSYWTQALPGYTPSKTVIFNNQIQTGCGTATAAVGPFYCPADRQVYLDNSFFDQMLPQLGAKGGDAAEAYVIAHEYGHHIQNLTGVMDQAQRSQQTGAGSPAVRLELQADCYAGVWLRHSTNDPNSPISAITQDDLTRAVDAARAVGDDRIQKSQTGSVQPDAWTHGSSAQRNKWLATGFNSGDPNQCNTFATNNLG